MNYKQSIEYLLALPDMERKNSGPLARSMSLAAMQALLEALDNPEKGRKTVHITGSKGKGSTSSFIASILSLAGSHNSLYTSPHLHSYTERICFDSTPCLEEDFAHGLSEIEPVITHIHQGDLGPISTFGATTALFFHLTQRKNLPWQIVEVGMGGLFDATNVFENTDIAVITSISLEHTSVLGRTVAEIAENKAGIIKPGSTVVLAKQQDPTVLPVIRNRCLELGAKLINVASEYQTSNWTIEGEKQTFSVQSNGSTRQFTISMRGVHQMDNALTAIAVADVLGIDENTINKGLKGVAVPGRMELVNTKPLVVLDGAHNGESARRLIAGLQRHFQYKRLFVIVGVNADKNIGEIIEALAPANEIIATRSQSEKAMDPQKIAEAGSGRNSAFTLTTSVKEALTKALDKADKEDLICITGSLYVVAEARELILRL
ncbi:MAG: bifunctional folylpolyglutamate synthase/dihydrofolate synthase [Candidatus Obscuribacterales bacterium]|nr:bifunctional folylpolyglutamate synthase/dihydrofolate synthase [Candidatus Obscuribacterales bacterium]